MKSSGIPQFEVRPQLTTVETLWVPVFQDRRKKPVTAARDQAELLKKLAKSDVMAGATKSLQFLRYGGKGGAEHVLLAGLGPADAAKGEDLRQAGGLTGGRL